MSGWRRIAAPVGVEQLAAALHDAVGQRELADVVQQAGRVGELLLALATSRAARRCRARTRATAAQWRAARESRSSSVRTRLDSTPHDRFAYSRVRSRATTTSRSMYVNAMTLRADERERDEPELARRSPRSPRRARS